MQEEILGQRRREGAVDGAGVQRRAADHERGPRASRCSLGHARSGRTGAAARACLARRWRKLATKRSEIGCQTAAVSFYVAGEPLLQLVAAALDLIEQRWIGALGGVVFGAR